MSNISRIINSEISPNLDKINDISININEIENEIENKPSNNTQKEIIEKRRNDHRCIVCNKGGLYNLRCKCDNYVCKKHKFNHSCTFDYKAHYRDELKKNNQKIVADKIDRI